MSTKKTLKQLSEQDVDRMVVAQADNDSAWGKPIHVIRKKSSSLSLPAELAARAAFLAQLHRTNSVEDWLMHIIQERIEIEEAAFTGVKLDISKSNRSILP